MYHQNTLKIFSHQYVGMFAVTSARARDFRFVEVTVQHIQTRSRNFVVQTAVQSTVTTLEIAFL